MSNGNLTKKQRSHAWIIFVIAAGFILFQFLLQFTSGILAKSIMHEFRVAALGASLVTSSYYFIYVIMQTPAGLLVDRFGARKLLSLGAIIAAIGCLLFAITHSLAIAVIARLCMGLGLSCAFVSALFLCRNWFPAKMYMFLIGLIESLAMFGVMFGNAYAANIITQLGWRSFIDLTFVIAVIFAIVTPIIIRNTPKPDAEPKPLTKISPAKHFTADVKALMKSKRAWANGIYSGILVSPQTTFIALWGIPFLMRARHYTLKQATFSSVLIFLGIAVSAPLFGIWFNYLKKPYRVLSLSAIITGILLSLIIFDLRLNYYMVSFIFLLIGISSNVYLWNYTIISDIVPQAAASTKIGFTNTLANGVGPVLQIITAVILSLCGHSYSNQGHVMYTAHEYQLGLSILPVLCFFAAILAFYCKRKKT